MIPTHTGWFGLLALAAAACVTHSTCAKLSSSILGNWPGLKNPLRSISIMYILAGRTTVGSKQSQRLQLAQSAQVHGCICRKLPGDNDRALCGTGSLVKHKVTLISRSLACQGGGCAACCCVAMCAGLRVVGHLSQAADGHASRGEPPLLPWLPIELPTVGIYVDQHVIWVL